MAEYIKKELVLAFCEDEREEGGCDVRTIINRVRNVKAADVVEVKHGRWIEKPFLLGTSNFCSLCDSFYGMPHGKFNYCPNCGARMDGEG